MDVKEARRIALNVLGLHVQQRDGFVPQRENRVALVISDMMHEVLRGGDTEAIDVLRDLKNVAIVEIENHVFAATAAEDESVIARSAAHRVAAAACIQHVVAGAASQELVAEIQHGSHHCRRRRARCPRLSRHR